MWIKSKHCAKPRRCDHNACVEVWPSPAGVWVRDSTPATAARRPVLSVTRGDWRALVASAKAGTLDR